MTLNKKPFSEHNNDIIAKVASFSKLPDEQLLHLSLPAATSSSTISVMTTRNQFWLLPILIIWLAFGLRLYGLDYQSIWWDEGHSIFVAEQPVAAIPTLPAMDVHPPAYFFLLHGWLKITGRSEFALRYLSLLFGTLLVAILWRFSAAIAAYMKIAQTSAAALAALFAAISPFYVVYSQEVRSYALIVLLATVSTFALWQIVFSVRDQMPDLATTRFSYYSPAGWLLLYVLATAVCLYTHYFTVFLLIFHNVVWLVWLFSARYQRPLRRLIIWLVAQLGVLLLFTPQLLLAVRQITEYTNPNLNPPSLSHFIAQSWQAYVVGLNVASTPARWGMVVIAVMVLGSWLFILIRALSLHNAKPVRGYAAGFSGLFLAAWLLIPLFAYYVVLQRQPSFEPRYLILATPPIFLLLALGLTQLPVPEKIPRWLVGLLPLPIFAFSLYNVYTNTAYFKDDSAGVAAWLAAETTPNDQVYVDVPHPFHYYVERQAIPATVQYLFVDIHTAAERLNREATGKTRLFWITWRGSDTDPRGVIPFLAQKAGQAAGQRDFKGYHIQWFNLPPDAVFSLPTALNPIAATFGDVLRLDGAAFGAASSTEPVWVTLHFSLLRDTNVNYKVSLRLRDDKGDIVAQQDKDLLNDRHIRTAAWPLADEALNQAINVYSMGPAAPGNYQLEVVVYNAEPPYPSEGVSGHHSADGTAAILGQVTVIP